MDLVSKITVRTIAKSLSAAELAACAQDAIAWQDKRDLPNGALRALAARLEAEAGIDDVSSLAQAEASVMREATLRFVAYQTGLRADQQ